MTHDHQTMRHLEDVRILCSAEFLSLRRAPVNRENVIPQPKRSYQTILYNIENYGIFKEAITFCIATSAH